MIRRGLTSALCSLTIVLFGHSAAANVAATPIILFGFGSSEIDSAGRVIIEEIAAKLRTKGDVSILVVGHADRAGPLLNNIELSRRRAEAVRDSLIAAGVPERFVATRALGEEQLAVPTGDGIREAANRRVEILIEGGGWAVDQP